MDNQTNDLVVNVTALTKAVKAASGIVKKKTQLVVLDFLTLNHIGSLDSIPHLATMMVMALTGLESQGFRAFITTMFPLKWDDTTKTFQEKPISNKAHKEECKLARTDFLETYENNYWLWIARNQKVEAKEVNWMGRVDSALASAQNPEKGGFSLDDVLLHIIEKEGIQLDTFMRLLAPKIIEGEVEEEPALEAVA